MSDLWPRTTVERAADRSAATYVFKNGAGDLVEGSVDASSGALLIVTCSTQVGCRIGCTFCSAGLKFVRSLRAEEIVAQVVRMIEDYEAGQRPVLVTFMGIGEPGLNQPAVIQAIEQLAARYPEARFYVSTSGPKVNYEPLLALGARLPVVGLQVSVHEPTDERRAALIPFRAKMTLIEIAQLGRAWYGRTGRQPIMNYCVHDGNSSEEDADLLAGLFDPHVWLAKVSVINASLTEDPQVAYERGRRLAMNFLLLLQRRGFAGQIFDQFGQREVAGACGQFQEFRDWARALPGSTASA